ncbi:DNA adenine methylase [Paenibacillus taichungensis]|uniref:DNA adenine methylase n=1 Tax=Paenibacillus taichungensis TaxID=484184 RepID=A0A329R1V8_9BACL|nr:DNA adenine methylase [Paenibacillus taichungensis]RAW18521.1 DNA adenine methylase [Paenibacillus taichungensis]
MKVQRILHYPGSKWSMADWIISHMPPHQTYLEPFFGSGAVFFNKQRSFIETINDRSDEVTNLFEIIRKRPEELARVVYWTPYSRSEYYLSYQTADDPLEKARRFLLRTWQAIGAKSSDRTGWRSNVQADKSPHKLATGQWRDLPGRILQATDRLQDVQIENQDAFRLIERYNRNDVLIYADPPYVLETRSNRIYAHEMTNQDHCNLLEILDNHPGPVLLSGYAHPMYDNRLKHWQRETKQVRAEAGRIRTEVLWINPVAAGQVGQMQLF